tara:strand:- start:663 stop:920 length:258 start_codon:yes stop_codon:yes gene_type:complete
MKLEECPLPGSQSYDDAYGIWKDYIYFEEKVGLIVKVIRNRLEQPLGYQVQIGKDILLCKSVVAEKYFESVGDLSNDTSRRISKV